MVVTRSMTRFVPGEEKIGKLPDSLLHRIIGFLETKCAMRTCILSKRWKHVPKTLPNLDFSGWLPENGTDASQRRRAKNFMKFLNTALDGEDPPSIRRFSLTVSHLLDESIVNGWIEQLIRRQVQELFLTCLPGRPYLLPPSFYICGSLTVLSLHGVIQFSLSLESMSFPKLRWIRLTDIDFGIGFAWTQFLTSCPVMEVLRISQCRKEYGGLKIESSTLKYLYIKECSFTYCHLKISAPSVKSFHYRSSAPAQLQIDSLPSLEKGSIDLAPGLRNNALAAMTELFNKFGAAKLLRVSVANFQVTTDADLNSLPVLVNLTNAHVVDGYPCSDFLSRRRILSFFKLTPNLTKIFFSRGTLVASEEDVRSLTAGSNTYLPCLETVILESLDEGPIELNGLTVLLCYAGFNPEVIILDIDMYIKLWEECELVERLRTIDGPDDRLLTYRRSDDGFKFMFCLKSTCW